MGETLVYAYSCSTTGTCYSTGYAILKLMYNMQLCIAKEEHRIKFEILRKWFNLQQIQTLIIDICSVRECSFGNLDPKGAAIHRCSISNMNLHFPSHFNLSRIKVQSFFISYI